MSQPAPPPDDGALDAGGLGDGVRTLIVADFADPHAALQSYRALTQIEDGRTIGVLVALVVSRGSDGSLAVQQATDRTTRRGAAWGAIGGAVLGVVFPPSIIGAALVSGAVGAAIGKGAQVHHKHQLAAEMQYAIDPGHAGVVALVGDPSAQGIVDALEPADRVVRMALTDAAARDIDAAARAAVGETRAT